MSSRALKPLLRASSWTVLLLAATLLAGSANARTNAHVSCGATITSDVVLHADLSTCPGDGLLVSGDGVTVDLGGHQIRGSGSGIGVSITGTHVTVKNGWVRGFAEGIHVASSQLGGDTRLSRLGVLRNAAGIVVQSPLGTIDESGIFDNQDDGVRIDRVGSWTVEDSTVANNGGAGISLFFARDATLARNSVTGNGGSGIESGPHVDRALIADNVVSRNGGFGIAVTDSTTQVLRNTVRRNGDTGISLVEGEGGVPFGQFYVIADNESSKNAGAGITACIAVPGDACAPGMVDGGGNTARNNRVKPECVNVMCSPTRS